MRDRLHQEQVMQRRKDVSLSTLTVDAMYVTPTGRLCRLASAARRGLYAGGDQFYFEYLDGAQITPTPDGFPLTAGNVRILRPGGWR
jgi:hypothetical protein